MMPTVVVHHPDAKYFALTGTGAADRAAAAGMEAEVGLSIEAEELVGAAD